MNIKSKTDKQLKRMCVNSWKKRLKLSVEDIIDGIGYPNAADCAFCIEYFGNDCQICPIYKTTGKRLCARTPYDTAILLYNEIRYNEHRRIEPFHKAVQEEIDFLESLEC